jgi:hypothetical protein
VRDLLLLSAIFALIIPLNIFLIRRYYRTAQKRIEQWALHVGFKIQGLRPRLLFKGRRFHKRFYRGYVFDIWGFDRFGRWRQGRLEYGYSVFGQQEWFETDWDPYS